MKFKAKNLPFTAGKPASRGGFTLAEVLAALTFMAIVIPVAVEGVRTASQAAEMAQRKIVAARVADRVISEYLVGGNSRSSGQAGVVREGVLDYQWTVRTEPWTEGPMRLLTVAVRFPVQGQEIELRMSTLVNNTSR